MTDTVTARVTHRFARATAEEVYDAWLTPEDVRAWDMIALRSMGLDPDPRAVEIDARVGGRFLFSDMRDGEEARHWGTYRVLDRPRVIEFTWFTSEEEEATATSVVRIEITPLDTGCEVTVTHEMDAVWAEYVPRTASGWGAMLEAIDRWLGERARPVAG